KEVKEEREKTLEIDNMKSRALDFTNEEIQETQIIDIDKSIEIKEEIDYSNLLELERRILKIKKSLKNLSNEDLKKVDELLKALENIIKD
ncbi:MAG: hypothetical protein ACRCZO_15085, partial [Cetobacterium sp.]